MAERFIREHEICYLFNESFDFYQEGEMPRKEAQQLADRYNECKGGYYVVRAKGEYRQHYENSVRTV